MAESLQRVRRPFAIERVTGTAGGRDQGPDGIAVGLRRGVRVDHRLEQAVAVIQVLPRAADQVAHSRNEIARIPADRNLTPARRGDADLVLWASTQDVYTFTSGNAGEGSLWRLTPAAKW
jgi:hypothetical protein